MSSIFILGAGFSRPAGMPLGDELFKEVIESAKNHKRDYEILKQDIDFFLEYYNDINNSSISEEQINFEDFISFLDIEHYLGLEGSKTWSEEGNKSQIIIRNHIAKILHEKIIQIKEDYFKLYIEFAKRLEPEDVIITFNYDTIIERTFERLKKPYKFHSFNDDGKTTLLKMHGSIDWFDIETYELQYKYSKESPYFNFPKHYIFNNYNIFQPEKILFISDVPGSLLNRIYRIKNLNLYLDKRNFVSEVPLIISPSFNKIIYLNPIRDLWYGFYKTTGNWKRFVIIGFSLPNHDDYIKQILHNLITKFQNLEESERLWEKSNLKIVDFKKNKEDIRKFKINYPFVNWNETDCYFNGFDLKAIEMIFK